MTTMTYAKRKKNKQKNRQTTQRINGKVYMNGLVRISPPTWFEYVSICLKNANDLCVIRWQNALTRKLKTYHRTMHRRDNNVNNKMLDMKQ